MEIAFKIFNLGVFSHSLVSMIYYKRGGCYRRALYMTRIDETYKPFIKVHKPIWSPFVQVCVYPWWVLTSWFSPYFWVVIGLIILAIVNTHIFFTTQGRDETNSFIVSSETNAFISELGFFLVTGWVILGW
jgi:hypothetical protein